MKKREVNFEVGDLVLTHLRKERFPKREYNKLKFKKTRPCRVLRKFSANAYEIELPLILEYLQFSMLLISKSMKVKLQKIQKKTKRHKKLTM